MQKKYIFVFFTVILLLSTSCTRNSTVGQPRVDRSGELWAQQTNIDVNGTDKNITTDGESAQLNDTVVPRVDFPIDEYKRLAKKGRATVRGMIYLDDGYGGKAYGKNTRLYLNPVTSYSKQWYDESYIQGYKLSKADSRLYNYLKFTTSDGSGKFAFFGIPSGNYYVIGSVNHNGKKIRIADEISVKSSGTVQAVLSRSMD